MPFEPRLFSGGDDHATVSAELPSALLSRDAVPKLLVADEAPKLLVTEDPDADLPDDLAALAAQLRDEAATLARQHPPRPADEPIAPAATPRRRGPWLWPAAAAVIVAAGLFAWRIEQWPIAPSEKPVPPRAPMAATQQTIEHHQAGASGPDLEKLRAGQGVAEVGIADSQAPTHGTTDELSMLRRQVDGFEKLIHRFQAELVARDAAVAESERKVATLQQENDQLRRQLRDAQAKP